MILSRMLINKKYNIPLNRYAPFRGGFEGLLFFWLRWLSQSSLKGAPLSFTLSGQKCLP